MRSHLVAFVLSNSKPIMNNFISEKKGFYKNSIYWGHTDSLDIEKKYWDLLDKAKPVGKIYAKVKTIINQEESFMDYP